MERRRGLNGKFDLLKVLLCASEEYKDESLTVHFFKPETKELFEGLLEEQRQRRLEVEEEEDEVDGSIRWCEDLPNQMKMQVINSVEEMPFFVETRNVRQSKRRRKASSSQSKRGQNRMEESDDDDDDDDNEGDGGCDDVDNSSEEDEDDNMLSRRIRQKESQNSTFSTRNILQDISNLSLEEHARLETHRTRSSRRNSYSTNSSSGNSIHLLESDHDCHDGMDIVCSDSSSEGTIDLTNNRESDLTTPIRNTKGSQNYDFPSNGGVSRRNQEDHGMTSPIDLISPIPVVAASSRRFQSTFFDDDDEEEEEDGSCNSDGTIDLCSP